MKNQREFRVTMLDGASLLERLTTELRFLIYQLRLAWTAWKRNPIGFSRSTLLEGWLQLRRAAAPNAVASFAVAVLVILSAVLLLVLLDNRSKGNLIVRHDDEETGLIVDLVQNPIVPKEGQAVGAGTNGRVGFRSGKGEGSGPKPKRSTGGGSGGLDDPLPAQAGKLPQPSEIPALIPKLPQLRSQPYLLPGLILILRCGKRAGGILRDPLDHTHLHLKRTRRT